MVEAYRLHPNAIKSLPRCGQGYVIGAAQVRSGLLQRGETQAVDGASPVCYPRLPKLLEVGCDDPLKQNDQARARGLNLYKRFVEAPAVEQEADAPVATPGAPTQSTAYPPRPNRPLRIVGRNPQGGRPRASTRLLSGDDVSSDPPSQ